jgi:hypothetical protein
MQRLFLFICVLLFLIGCNQNNKEQIENIRIQSLTNSLDSIEKLLLKNEIDTLAALGVATNAVELRIKNYYNLDSIDYEFGKKMDQYKVMRRSLGPLGKNFVDIKNGINEERSALKNLTNDISNNIGTREENETNIQFEKEKVNQLEVLLKEYLIEKNKTMTTFHKLHKELDSFSIELMKENEYLKLKKRQ